ncbi:MAG: hypothetical protein V9E95_00640 [Methanothrix soehngenii]
MKIRSSAPSCGSDTDHALDEIRTGEFGALRGVAGWCIAFSGREGSVWSS